MKENDLWGATPFASVVHLSLDAQRALNASLPSPPAGAAPEGAPGLDAAAEAAAVEVAAVEALEHGLHRTVCFAYFLPNRYQAPTPDGGEEEVGGKARVKEVAVMPCA